MKLARITSRFALPLLAKELIEQAARRRTYIVRTIYATLLFTASYLIFYQTLEIGNASPYAVLGHGREVFEVSLVLQFFGVTLFMPAITCGVITQEKEKNSLMLLFLTRLGPWTIVFEKLLGRLIPMLTFLLLSLPLLVFGYVLGGISVEYLVAGVWMLLVAALQMGALAVACSAWFRTTVGSLIWSYLFGFTLMFGPAIIVDLLGGEWALYNTQIVQFLVKLGVYQNQSQPPYPFFAPAQIVNSQVIGWGGVLAVVARSVPILLSAGVLLVLARMFVVRRAFVPPRNRLLKVLKSLDGVFTRLNQNRITRGIELVRNSSSLPEVDPVAWRETTKRSLGRSHYLFRIFIALEVPIGILCVLIAFTGSGHLTAASSVLFLLWLLAVMIVSVHSASLIAGERSHQTLDVLCTTPLTGREILRQKFRAVWRVIAVLLIPFVTVITLAVWWRRSSVESTTFYHTPREFDSALYLVCWTLELAVYLPLAAWLSMLLGLAVRSQGRAILASLGIIAAWCVAPLVFVVLPLTILFPTASDDNYWVFGTLLSPAAIIAFNEFNFEHLDKISKWPWFAVGMNFVVYGSALAVIRQICLLNADRWLGRAESIDREQE